MSSTSPTIAPSSSNGTPAWADFLAMSAVAVFMTLVYFLLMNLSKRWTAILMARIKEEAELRKLHPDRFIDDNGYSWDYCIVFKVREENEKLSKKQHKFDIAHVISRLNHAGLETKSFYSIQDDEIYCKIRAPLKRLMQEADRTDYRLPLDPDSLEVALRAGRPNKWKPIEIPNTSIATSLSPYQYMYAEVRYDKEKKTLRSDVTTVYQRFDGQIFHSTDRLKLIASILRAREHENGCHLDMRSLKIDECILGCMSLHDDPELARLEEKWMKLFASPWSMDVDMMKLYFGEKVGLFFLFQAHYTTWLLPAGFVGILFWINVALDDNEPSAADMPWYAGLMALWATSFLESWKRQEKWHAMKWGMVGFEEEENVRPQFYGEVIQSPVDGSKELFYPRYQSLLRLVGSVVTIGVIVLSVIGVVASLFILRLFMIKSNITINGVQAGPIITSIIQAVVIQILNYFYNKIAGLLTDLENHRTDTEYEDNLIGKIFVFQFVNSYAALFYVGFVKQWIPDRDVCLYGNCLKELQQTLGTIFISRLVSGIVLSTTIPAISASLRERTNFSGITAEAKKEISGIERTFMKEPYDSLLGTLPDYADLAIQFGYATMFVSAFPLSTSMCFISNYIMLRVNGWKLFQVYQRPDPRSAEDIGTWHTILWILSMNAVFVNAGLIAFAGDYTEQYRSVHRVWIFVGIIIILLGTKEFIAFMVPDAPHECAIQKKRLDYIESKLINDAADDEDDPDDDEDNDDKESVFRKSAFKFSNFMINKRDSLYNQPGDIVVRPPEEVAMSV